MPRSGSDRQYDVAVVGAGPGGAIAARECARAGLKTLLIDESHFPRYKLCGGGLTEAARDAIGFRLDPDVIEREVSRFRFVHGKRAFEVDGRKRAVTMVLRDRFDAFLAEKAVEEGAEFVEGVRISSANNVGDVVTLAGNGKRFFARAVIGADGVNSVISRLVREPFRKSDLALCVGVEVPARYRGSMEPDLIEIETGVIRYGYGWIFPKRHSFSVGYGTYLSHSSELRGALLNYLKRNGAKGSFEILGHMLPLGGVARRACADRIILVGDAAGYVDPFQGEGMRYAMTSGKIAGKVLADAFSKGDLSASGLAAYEKECYERFGRDLKWARRLAYVVYNLLNIVYSVADENDEIFRQYLKVLAGRRGYKEFAMWIVQRWPFLLAKTFAKRGL